MGIEEENESDMLIELGKRKVLPAFLKGQSHAVPGTKKKQFKGEKTRHFSPHSVYVMPGSVSVNP